MNYWIHRITGGCNALPLASQLFSNGWLSIGWAYLSSPENLEHIQESREAFEKLFPKKYRNRNNLWRFINEMKPGDMVVVPRPYKFAVCKIVDDEILTARGMPTNLLIDWNKKRLSLGQDGWIHNINGDRVDLGFFRKIEIIQDNIPRDRFASAKLQSRMKIRQTNASIDDLKANVNDSIERFKEKKPLNLKAEILEEASSIVLDKISKITGSDRFEELVEWYLRSLGARVETPSKNDTPSGEGDADRVAYFERINHTIMVQVKKHDSETKTDDWAVCQIEAFRNNHDYDDWSTSLWVISSAGGFSEAARKKAQEANVRLIDGNEFAKMILEKGIGTLDI
jgi:predicted Mrr-cat superfamily restriction endonuclease